MEIYENDEAQMFFKHLTHIFNGIFGLAGLCSGVSLICAHRHARRQMGNGL